jgi:hypothetical protein
MASTRWLSHRCLPVQVVVAVALAAVTASFAAPTAQASADIPLTGKATGEGSIGVRLLDVPVDEADNPRARVYIIDDLRPATTIHRRIEVSNTTDSPLRVVLYPDAASIAHGSFVGAAGRTPNDLTTWTTVSRTTLDIPAGAVDIDTVTIKVPQDAAPGERYAVIWAATNGPTGGNISLVSRVGIRMYLAVSGNNPLASSFTVDTLTAERDSQGSPVVKAEVHNTGGRALDMSGTLDLSEVSGSLRAGPYGVQLGTTLAPGQSEPVQVILSDQVPDGPWNATIALQSGLLHESYQARITFPHEPGIGHPATAHAKPTHSHLAVLISIALAALLLIVAGLLIVIRRRKRRAAYRPDLPPMADRDPKVGDTSSPTS